MDDVVVWSTHKNLEISDVHTKRRNEIAEFMLNNYFMPNQIFAKLDYTSDPNSGLQYVQYVKHILAGECCLLAEDPRRGEVKAVMLAKNMTERWCSWAELTVAVGDSKFWNIVDLKYRLIHKFAFDHPEYAFDSMHIFEYFIAEDLRGDSELLAKMFAAISEVSRFMKIHRLTYISLSKHEHNVAKSVGFTPISTIYYTLHEIGDERPLEVLRTIDEMEAVLFEMFLPPVVPYYEIKVPEIDEIAEEREERERVSKYERLKEEEEKRFLKDEE